MRRRVAVSSYQIGAGRLRSVIGVGSQYRVRSRAER